MKFSPKCEITQGMMEMEVDISLVKAEVDVGVEEQYQIPLYGIKVNMSDFQTRVKSERQSKDHYESNAFIQTDRDNEQFALRRDAWSKGQDLVDTSVKHDISRSSTRVKPHFSDLRDDRRVTCHSSDINHEVLLQQQQQQQQHKVSPYSHTSEQLLKGNKPSSVVNVDDKINGLQSMNCKINDDSPLDLRGGGAMSDIKHSRNLCPRSTGKDTTHQADSENDPSACDKNDVIDHRTLGKLGKYRSSLLSNYQQHHMSGEQELSVRDRRHSTSDITLSNLEKLELRAKSKSADGFSNSTLEDTGPPPLLKVVPEYYVPGHNKEVVSSVEQISPPVIIHVPGPYFPEKVTCPYPSYSTPDNHKEQVLHPLTKPLNISTTPHIGHIRSNTLSNRFSSDEKSGHMGFPNNSSHRFVPEGIPSAGLLPENCYSLAPHHWSPSAAEDPSSVYMWDSGDRCVVCGDVANGNFFGAVVCLPCKSFFIRCTKDGEPCILQQCAGNCDIKKQLRNRCQYCRYQRCLSVGMSRREKPETVQPRDGEELCRVCGDLANGIHFGVYTCEGCKKFFRRGLKENRSYTCKDGHKCRLNPRNRNNCRYCRYQKCLRVGMSREAIKMGRPRKLYPSRGLSEVDHSFHSLGRRENMKALSRMEDDSNHHGSNRLRNCFNMETNGNFSQIMDRYGVPVDSDWYKARLQIDVNPRTSFNSSVNGTQTHPAFGTIDPARASSGAVPYKMPTAPAGQQQQFTHHLHHSASVNKRDMFSSSHYCEAQTIESNFQVFPAETSSPMASHDASSTQTINHISQYSPHMCNFDSRIELHQKRHCPANFQNGHSTLQNNVYNKQGCNFSSPHQSSQSPVKRQNDPLVANWKPSINTSGYDKVLENHPAQKVNFSPVPTLGYQSGQFDDHTRERLDHTTSGRIQASIEAAKAKRSQRFASETNLSKCSNEFSKISTLKYSCVETHIQGQQHSKTSNAYNFRSDPNDHLKNGCVPLDINDGTNSLITTNLQRARLEPNKYDNLASPKSKPNQALDLRLNSKTGYKVNGYGISSTPILVHALAKKRPAAHEDIPSHICKVPRLKVSLRSHGLENSKSSVDYEDPKKEFFKSDTLSSTVKNLKWKRLYIHSQNKQPMDVQPFLSEQRNGSQSSGSTSSMSDHGDDKDSDSDMDVQNIQSNSLSREQHQQQSQELVHERFAHQHQISSKFPNSSHIVHNKSPSLLQTSNTQSYPLKKTVHELSETQHKISAAIKEPTPLASITSFPVSDYSSFQNSTPFSEKVTKTTTNSSITSTTNMATKNSNPNTCFSPTNQSPSACANVTVAQSSSKNIKNSLKDQKAEIKSDVASEFCGHFSDSRPKSLFMAEVEDFDDSSDVVTAVDHKLFDPYSNEQTLLYINEMFFVVDTLLVTPHQLASGQKSFAELKALDRMVTKVFGYSPIKVTEFWKTLYSSFSEDGAYERDAGMSSLEQAWKDVICAQYHKQLQACDEDVNPPVTNKNDQEIWPQRGEDTDHWKHFIERVDRQTYAEAKFVLNLPGMDKIDVKDRIKVASIYRLFGNTILMASKEWFDPVRKKFKFFWNWRMPEDHLLSQFHNLITKTGRCIFNLHMDDTEVAILSVLNIMSPENGSFSYQHALSEYIETVLGILAKYLHSINVDPDDRIPELLAIMPKVRHMSTWYTNLIRNMTAKPNNFEKTLQDLISQDLP